MEFHSAVMPGGKKEGDSSGDETKKRPCSPNTDNNDSADSLDGNRRSRRKKSRVGIDLPKLSVGSIKHIVSE